LGSHWGVSLHYPSGESACIFSCGNADPNSAEQGVAFNFDCAYLSRAAAPAALFYDLERIEVLKGPPGTKALIDGLVSSMKPAAEAVYGLPGVLNVDPADTISVHEIVNVALLQTAGVRVARRVTVMGPEVWNRNAGTRLWHEKQSPDMAKRLRAMQGAKTMIEQRAGLVFGELERAVKAPPHKAKRLREANTDAERAFAVQGA
jgi:hypothetical protein